MLMCRFVFLLSRIQRGCINKVFRGLRSYVSIAFVQSHFCRRFFFVCVCVQMEASAQIRPILCRLSQPL